MNHCPKMTSSVAYAIDRRWLFGAVDDSARAALMLALAGAAVSLLSQSQRQDPAPIVERRTLH